MPRRALRCVVDLKLRAVTAPGVWLPSREDVYLSISLFGQYRNTNLVPSVFPLYFKEDFRFEKTYYTALDPSEVSDYLEDELIVFELLQLSPYGGANRLASFSSNARDFLYPVPSMAPCYASTTRELLFRRSLDFPGISPKLEFVTVTNIKESLSPELDALEDALIDEKRSRRSRSRSRSRPSSRASMRTFVDVDPAEDKKNYHKPTVSSICRSRSPSPASRWKSEESFSPRLSSTDSRPPFVVRHLENSLIGRTPGSKGQIKKGKKKGKRFRTRSTSALSDSGSDYASYPSLTHKYRLKKSVSDDEDPLPRISPRQFLSDDEDAEVAALTDTIDDLYIKPRSPSPLLYNPSFRERYGLRPLTPLEKLDLDLRVERALRRSRSRERLARLELEDSLRRSRSPYRYLYYRDLDDLALETSLARRRLLCCSRVHLDEGSYWSERAAKFQGKSHRQVFNDSLSKLYSKMYRNAKERVPV